MKRVFAIIITSLSINMLLAQTDNMELTPDVSNSIHLYMHSAQAESVKPTFDVSFDRPVAIAEIEGKNYENVIVKLNVSANTRYYNGVYVTVKDPVSRKIILNKSLRKAYLYGFSDGTITVGKGNVVDYMVLYKKEEGKWIMRFREKGLY